MNLVKIQHVIYLILILKGRQLQKLTQHQHLCANYIRNCFYLLGLTGVFLILVLMVMYIFASQTARRYMHNTFWMFHKLFIVLYVLMMIHGLLWLTQKPNFIAHFIAPCLLFIVDKTMSVTRRKMKLDVLQADILPSCKQMFIESLTFS